MNTFESICNYYRRMQSANVASQQLKSEVHVTCGCFLPSTSTDRLVRRQAKLRGKLPHPHCSNQALQPARSIARLPHDDDDLTDKLSKEYVDYYLEQRICVIENELLTISTVQMYVLAPTNPHPENCDRKPFYRNTSPANQRMRISFGRGNGD